MPHRYCLALDLKDDPAVIAAYEEHHRHVWPEIVQSIRDAGVEVLEIYRTGNRLFMIMEVGGRLLVRGEGGCRRGESGGAEVGGADVAVPAGAPLGEARGEVGGDGEDLRDA